MVRNLKRFFYWGNIINCFVMLILIGSVASIINGQTINEYKTSLFTYFSKINDQLTLEESFAFAKNMAMSFTIVLIIVFVLTAIANYLLNKDRFLMLCSFLFFVAGMVTYVGTKGILSFNALFYWVSMGYSLYRKKEISVQNE